MKCFYCEKTAFGICSQCCRGVCEDHANSKYTDALFCREHNHDTKVRSVITLDTKVRSVRTFEEVTKDE